MSTPQPLPWAHLVAAGSLLLYAAGSAWWVHGLGRDYRRDLLAQATPPPPSLAPAPPAEPVVQAPPRAPADLAPTPEPGRIALEPARPTLPTPPPVAAPPPVLPIPEPPPVVAVNPAPPVLDPIWNQPPQQRVWDLQRLKPEDEQQLGATLHQAILKLHDEVIAGPLPGRLAAAARPFLKACTRQDVRYTFTVLDCPEVNAFSHPGGYIYVCRGLFDLIAPDEDEALEFLVCHELAHVDQFHAIACLRDPELLKKGLGTSLLFCSLVLPLGYTEQQDLDADRWATQKMSQAGRSKHETLKFLRKLEAYATDHGFGVKRMRPLDAPPVDLIDNHLRGHIIPRDRLMTLQEQFWKPTPAPPRK